MSQPRQASGPGDVRAPEAGLPAGSGAPPADAAGAADAGPAAASRWRRLPAWWPLALILAAQAALSARLVHANTAFLDEASYLWAGHLEWAHWLHSAPVPPFASYFSGAPVIYPPLGALADSIGGLAGARILSLIFMLAATALLWGSARRLFGPTAAFFAAALFGVAGPTLHLGAFATYDALSMFLVAMAAWMVIRCSEWRDATGWLAAAGAVLALANAAAYSSVIFDPIVIALAALAGRPGRGARQAAMRAMVVLVVVAVLITAGILAGGSTYLTGIGQTTVARVGGAESGLTVLADSWSWTGAVVALALLAVVIGVASRANRPRAWLLAVLTLAALLGPLEHARLHTTASLNKHVDLGVWFAAIAAGFAVSWLVDTAGGGRHRAVTLAACVLALAYPATLGAAQSMAFATSWPDSGSFTAVLGPLVDGHGGRLLVEDPSIAEYYLPAGRQWQRWSSTRNIVLPSGGDTGGPGSAGVTGAGNAGVFSEFITEGYFSVIALNFADTTGLDHRINDDINRSHRYRLIRIIPYGKYGTDTFGTYKVWERRPPS